MGSYTEYELTTTPAYWFTEETCDGLSELTGFCVDRLASGYWTSEIKWYSHNEDMLAFSAAHPEAFFVLEGLHEGGERWQKRYNAGKCIGKRVAWEETRWDKWRAADDKGWSRTLPDPYINLNEFYTILGVDENDDDAQRQAIEALMKLKGTK